MRRRFVVLLDSATPEQDKEFKEWVNEQHFGWWHWLSQSWLITSTSTDMRAATLRDKATEIYDSTHLFVLELRGTVDDTWSGFGPKSSSRDMFEWIKNNWK